MINLLSWNGWVLRTLGRLDEAEALGAEAARRTRIVLSDQGIVEGLTVWATFMRHGKTLSDMERFEQAEAVLLEARAIRVSQLGAQARSGSPAKYLAELYDAWHSSQPGAGYDAKAAEWRNVRRGLDVETGERDGDSP